MWDKWHKWDNFTKNQSICASLPATSHGPSRFADSLLSKILQIVPFNQSSPGSFHQFSWRHTLWQLQQKLQTVQQPSIWKSCCSISSLLTARGCLSTDWFPSCLRNLIIYTKKSHAWPLNELKAILPSVTQGIVPFYSSLAGWKLATMYLRKLHVVPWP